MMKLKKAALGISGKLGLLNTHRSLVVAVSEEKQVHEALLKVVLSRVNGMLKMFMLLLSSRWLLDPTINMFTLNRRRNYLKYLCCCCCCCWKLTISLKRFIVDYIAQTFRISREFLFLFYNYKH